MISTKNFLIILITCFFIFVTVKFYSFYIEHSEWQYSDWLINYQGGFIRRGFIGEILFQLYRISSISLDIIILIFVITLYLFLSYFLFKSLKYLKDSNENILIFLSPGFFLYPIMNSGVVGRKEILIFCLMGFFVFCNKYFKSKNLLIILVVSFFLLCLSHSGLLFYTPYMVFLYILIKLSRDEKIKFFELFTIFGSILIIFLLIILNHQTTTLNVIKICESVSDFVTYNCKDSGQFFALSMSANDHVSFFRSGNYFYNSFFVYILSFFAVNFF